MDGTGVPVLTKFGSVVGFSHKGDWAVDKVLFNPVNGSPSYFSYTSVPCYEEADYNAGATNITSPNYTNATNIRRGKGDICALVGYTANEIANMSDTQLMDVLNDSQWVAPTKENTRVFLGSSTGQDDSRHFVPSQETDGQYPLARFPDAQTLTPTGWFPLYGWRRYNGPMENGVAMSWGDTGDASIGTVIGDALCIRYAECKICTPWMNDGGLNRCVKKQFHTLV